MAEQMYQVVGHLALVTTNSVNGPVKAYAYRGALISAESGATAAEITHNLDIGLIAPFGDAAEEVGPVSLPGNEAGIGHGEDPGTVNHEAPEPPATPDGEAEAEAEFEQHEAERKQSEAKAKLPKDGSAPAGNASHEVWVEYAVVKGYDRGEAEKATRDELKALLK